MIEALPTILVLFFSVVLHEIAHGLAALKLGDPTARDAGRLTLNPIAHVDLLGTVILPIILFLRGGPMFGWAKPVPINPRYFRDRRQGMAIVGAAGPATNVLIALVAASILHLLRAADPSAAAAFRETLVGHTENAGLVVPMLFRAVVINVLLATFNMLPIPPLDGSRVIIPFVPRNVGLVYYQLEPYGMLIVIALYFTGILFKIIGPVYTVVASLFLGV